MEATYRYFKKKLILIISLFVSYIEIRFNLNPINQKLVLLISVQGSFSNFFVLPVSILINILLTYKMFNAFCRSYIAMFSKTIIYLLK